MHRVGAGSHRWIAPARRNRELRTGAEQVHEGHTRDRGIDEFKTGTQREASLMQTCVVVGVAQHLPARTRCPGCARAATDSSSLLLYFSHA